MRTPPDEAVRGWRRVAVIAIALGCCSLPTRFAAQQRMATVSGMVLDTAGAPFAGVEVSLLGNGRGASPDGAESFASRPSLPA